MPTTAAAANKPRESSSSRTGRLGLRAAPNQEALLRRAAEASNKTLTEFILDSACAVAEQTLLDQRYFLVEQAQWDAFNAALDRPAKPDPKLKGLLQHKAPWEK
ncbi:MAG: DUF1778 domain-containing protein [Sterolibacteriaceae bacterium MAG5]|nr:DUF1778 domain-containing protein [Candidatus Nitricoxidireducens bremensis]